MEFGLAGKVALVTGAGQGIGRTVGLALAQEGASVAFHYRTSQSGADTAVVSCAERKQHAMAMRYDSDSACHILVNRYLNRRNIPQRN